MSFIGHPLTRGAVEITQITDTTDDEAVLKVRRELFNAATIRGVVPCISILPALDSITAGFRVSEAVNCGGTNSLETRIINVNYAPPAKKEGTKDNARKDFYCADLGNNVFVSGTSNGYEFSCVKNQIIRLYRVVNSNDPKIGKGERQFRSCYVLPYRGVDFALVDAKENRTLENVFPSSCELAEIDDIDAVIPSLPDETLAYQVDNFGNVKLFLSEADRQLLDALSQQRKPISFAFARTSIEVDEQNSSRYDLRKLFPTLRNLLPPKTYKGTASETLFDAKDWTNVVALNSSSNLGNGKSVGIIATMRQSPGTTRPLFDSSLPPVGARVFLAPARPTSPAADAILYHRAL